MNDKMLQEIKKQHVDNYKKALIETIQNNTKALIDDDVIPLFKKPPLDSMDIIRNKMIIFAKKNKIVLNSLELDKLLNNYRKKVICCGEELKKVRISYFTDIVNKYQANEFDYIVFYKKDFVSLNKNMKSIVKAHLIDSIDSTILKKIDLVVPSDIDESVFNLFVKEESNFLKKLYLKQLLDSFDIKLLVKDTTLINSVKEQGDRYIFTLKNSRLLNDFD